MSAGARPIRRSTFPPMATTLAALAVAGAWLVILIAELPGGGSGLHGHGVATGPSAWAGAPAFLGDWLLMCAAMMMPSSVPTVLAVERASVSRRRPARAVTAFLTASFAIWAASGFLAFLGSGALQNAIASNSWLAGSPMVWEAAVVGFAGAYQFAPLKRRSLRACRHHADGATASATATGAFRLGIRHASACLASSWALMLVMVAAGPANLPWMVLVTIAMTFELTGRHVRRAAGAVGLGLLWFAGIVLLPAGLVGPR